MKQERNSSDDSSEAEDDRSEEEDGSGGTEGDSEGFGKDEKWEVEKIFKRKYMSADDDEGKRPVLHYWISWAPEKNGKTWPKEWVPAETLVDSQFLINEFEACERVKSVATEEKEKEKEVRRSDGKVGGKNSKYNIRVQEIYDDNVAASGYRNGAAWDEAVVEASQEMAAASEGNSRNTRSSRR